MGNENEAMLTILYYVTVKEGNEQAVQELVTRLATTTRAEDAGCLAYTFYQQQDNPREYVLFEQWRDQAALDAHLARLQAVFGPPRPGGRVPAAILDLYEKTRSVRYRVAA